MDGVSLMEVTDGMIQRGEQSNTVKQCFQKHTEVSGMKQSMRPKQHTHTHAHT